MELTDGKIGARARRLREDRGLTREQLAARSGVSTSTVARLELGTGLPGTAAILQIASALNVNVAELLEPSPVTPVSAPADSVHLAAAPQETAS